MDSVVNKPPQFIILRGLPGSGKSTLAKALVKKFSHYNFEADHFFEHTLESGEDEYIFNPTLIEYAHAQCQGNVAYMLSRGKNVIVSNTTTNWNHLHLYVKIASLTGVEKIDVVECTDTFGSVRNVPEETYTRMKRNWASNKQISELPYIKEIYTDLCYFYNSEEYRQLYNI